jgi:hypothetical protein
MNAKNLRGGGGGGVGVVVVDDVFLLVAVVDTSTNQSVLLSALHVHGERFCSGSSSSALRSVGLVLSVGQVTMMSAGSAGSVGTVSAVLMPHHQPLAWVRLRFISNGPWKFKSVWIHRPT